MPSFLPYENADDEYADELYKYTNTQESFLTADNRF